MRTYKQSLFALILMLLSGFSLAQTTLTLDNAVHTHFASGTYEDFIIPSTPGVYDEIEFVLNGGDGGRRRVKNLCKKKGGEGAKVTVSFTIGTGAGELKPGGTIRIIAGEKGVNQVSNAPRGAGGAGGSGLLYMDPGGSHTFNKGYPRLNLIHASTSWILLAVAGGGGGAGTNGVCSSGGAGQGGRSGTSGGSGDFNKSSGGTGGDGGTGIVGGAVANGGSFTSGGGGGYKSNATNADGKSGGLTGDNGGNRGRANGGFGYGSGGSGDESGGGGGGYSGGGGAEADPSFGSDPGGGGGGGSFANADNSSSVIGAGGTRSNPDDGYISYQFKDQSANTPHAICQDVSLSLDINGNATLQASAMNNGSTDPTGGSMSYCVDLSTCPSTTVLTCSDLGSTLFTLKVTNSVGSSTCNSDVTVEDNLAPTALCKKFIQHTNAQGNATLTTANINNNSTDNCSDASDLAFSLDQTSFSYVSLGSNVHTVTLTVSDEEDNVGTCTAQVTLIDNLPPIAICSNQTVNLSANSIASLNRTVITSGSYDEGGAGLRSIVGSISFNCANIGTNTRNFTVKDFAGNASSCTASITVKDIKAPGITCPANISKGNDTGSCGADVVYSVNSSDNCSVSHTQTDASGLTSGDEFPIGTTTQTYTATDADGNTASCSFTIAVADTENPSISCPSSFTVSTVSGTCQVLAGYQYTTSDNCPAPIFQSYGQQNVLLPPMGLGTHTIPLSVTDASGNSATCSFQVTIVDQEAPDISCPANISASNDAGECGAIVSYAVSSSDHCTTVSHSQTDITGFTSGDEFPIGTTTLTYTATDASGNTASCSFEIEVIDNEAPVINCPANISVNNETGTCTGEISGLIATATDNCPATVSIDKESSKRPFRFPLLNLAPLTLTIPITSTLTQPALQGGTLIIYVRGDLGGNKRFNITGEDNTLLGQTNPTPTPCSPSYTPVSIQLSQTQINTWGDDGQLTIVLNPAINMFPVCNQISSGAYSRITYQVSGVPIINSVNNNKDDASGDYQIGSNSVTFTATDAAGNTANCQVNVTVTDTENPTISCPQNITQSNDPDDCAAVINYSVTHADNCIGENMQQTVGMASGSVFSKGTTTNSFTVTDAAGNTADCSFDVTITDDQIPTITCPQHIIPSNDQDDCGAIVTYPFVSASDNCTGEIIAQTAGMSSGNHFPVGTSTNSFTVTDASGNTASCSFDVTVTDDQLPTIDCPANISLSNDPGDCGRVVIYLRPNGQDNCNSSTQMTAGQGSGNQFVLGTQTESYQVTDASGNTASCAFTITITDEEEPTISLTGANPVILCEGEAYVESGATASDNCDNNVGQNISIDNSAVNTAQEGIYTVTYDATDIHGNSALQVIRTVIVKHTPAQLAPQNCGSCNQIRFDFCEGESTPNLEALLTANSNYELTANFRWYTDNSNSQGSLINKPVPNMAKNTRFYWVSQVEDGCEGEVRRVRVRVRKTSIVVLDLPAIGCGTGQIDLAAWVSDSRNIATSFTFFDSDPTLGGNPVGNVTANRGQVNSGQYAVVSLPSNPVTYYAVASNNTGCQVTGSDEVISGAGASLDSVPDLTVNAGDLVQISVTSPDATHIMWLNHSSFNNPYIGLLGSSGMGDLVFTAQNSGSSPQTAMLRAIAYNNNCAGEVRDFYITVLPGTQNRQVRNDIQLTASKLNAHDVQLNWQIEYEFALTSIEIEKLKNDGEWEMVGHHGVGSHHDVTLQDGSYQDRSGMGNLIKYRLKLIHADGRAIWSQEIEISFDFFDSKRFTLYPNPSNGRFNLRSAVELQGEWRYKLSDQLGRTILIGKLQENETAFDIRHLPTAHYFLLLTSPEGKQYLERVVKN